MPSELVVFLGAGFSKEADLPVMSEFAKYSESELQSLIKNHGPDSNSPRNASQFLIENGKLFEAFRQYLNEITRFNIDSFSPDNMEDIFTTAEMMHTCNFRDIYLDGRNRSLCEILRAIKRWLWKIYHRIPIHNFIKNNIDVAPYEGFF